MYNKSSSRQGKQTVLIATLWGIGLLTLSSSLSAATQAAINETTTVTDKTATDKPMQDKTVTNKTKTKASPEKLTAQPVKPVYAVTLAGAKQAFKDTNYLDALKILIKLEDKYAGSVEYDYLLGRCALETKNFDTAAAAFIRALTIDPDFAAARFELARTYYSKGVAKLSRGPFEQARAEFKIVATMNPPAELRQAIKQYQSNIDKYLEVRETEFSFFFDTTIGYDTNINSSSNKDFQGYTDSGTGASYLFDLRKPDEERESGFGQAQAGFGIALPLFSNNFEVFGNLLFGGKSYERNHDYDHTWDQVQMGLRHYGESNKKTLRFRFKSTDRRREGERYHEQGEGMFEWASKINKNTALTFWLLGGDSSYYGYETHVFSVNYNRQGIEATRISDGKSKASFQLLFFTGRDNSQDCGDNNNNNYCPDAYARDVRGLRVAFGANLFDQSRFYSSLYLEDSDYDRDFLNQRRKDKRIEALLAINSGFGDSMYVRPEILYIQNDSTLYVFDHDRWVTSITIGWGF